MASIGFGNLTLLSVALAALFIGGSALARSDSRRVDGGTIAGTTGRDPQILVFRGIPYAAPPVGHLRWRPPSPVEAWRGVRTARDFAPSCMGRNFGSQSKMSEDCLYLNVWTPTPEQDARLPVLVWIHGGGFQGGGGYHPSYEGEEFAKRGVVVVTFNYRVGVFGFLAHPDLTNESERHTSGNYGLLDQVAALRWVQRNITAFGGDPTKVTIAGESAGAYSVSAHTAAPMSRGLFRAAIAQSGGYLGPGRDAIRSLAESERAGSNFALSLGFSDIAGLRALSADELMRAVEKMPDFFAFQPCIDGDFLQEPVYMTYVKHRESKVPLLIGSNTDEGAFLLPPQRSTAGQLQSQLLQKYGSSAKLVRDIYPTRDATELRRSELNLYADDGFTYPMWKWAELYRQEGLVAYYYVFGRVLPVLPDQSFRGIPRGQIGAFHGDEVPYVFGNLDLVDSALDGAPRKGRWETQDYALSRTLLGYWANFVKTGDPNGANLPEWPRYANGVENPLMHFIDRAEAGLDERISRMGILDAAFQADR